MQIIFPLLAAFFSRDRVHQLSSESLGRRQLVDLSADYAPGTFLSFPFFINELFFKDVLGSQQTRVGTTGAPPYALCARARRPRHGRPAAPRRLCFRRRALRTRHGHPESTVRAGPLWVPHALRVLTGVQHRVSTVTTHVESLRRPRRPLRSADSLLHPDTCSRTPTPAC